MVDVLSQEEIDSLLTTIRPTKNKEEPKDISTTRRIKIYDFKRPDKFSKDQIRTIQIIYETFARLTSTSLSAQLRTVISMHVVSVDQITYEEFIRAIPSPTTLGLIKMEPLKGSSILEIDPKVTFSIIDRLFGGPGTGSKTNRELTDIELAVMEKIIIYIATSLREAWANVIDISTRLQNIETNPQFAQVVPPSDMVVLITLETKVNNIEGITNFCIPYITLEPLINKLSAQYWYSSIKKGVTNKNFNMLRRGISIMEVELTAEIGNTSISIEELISLEEGDIIKLPQSYLNGQLKLKIGNKKKFSCTPGLVGKNVAVKISNVIEYGLTNIYNNVNNIK